MTDKIKLFEQKQIRTHWDAENEEWYFSVVDICNVLSESSSKDPGAYWRKLKQRLKAEGSEVVTNCHELKMQAADGKFYKTDCMTTKNILRLVQSIPSPNAEPFKMWLAEVGNQRLQSIEMRKELTQKHASPRLLPKTKTWPMRVEKLRILPAKTSKNKLANLSFLP